METGRLDLRRHFNCAKCRENSNIDIDYRKPYDERKCGIIGVDYSVRKWKCGEMRHKEHFHLTCERCGYAWEESVNDDWRFK